MMNAGRCAVDAAGAENAIRHLLTPAERLCVLLSQHRLTGAERAYARGLVGAVRCWDDVWALADANRIAPLAHHHLRVLGCAGTLPAAVWSRFARQAHEVRHKNAARLAIARPVLARCIERGVRIALLKGVFLGEAIYRNPYYKRMSDVDVLVPEADLPGAVRAYAETGLRPIGGDADLTPGRVRFTHHLAVRVSADGRCMVDTQWGLVTPLRGYRLDYAAIWARCEPLAFRGLPLWRLSPEDNLHHLCLHLSRFKIALGDLADVANLIRCERARLSWERFHDAVVRAGTAGAVYRALALAQRLSPLVEVEECLRALAPRAGVAERRDVRRRATRLPVLLRIGTDHLERVQRDFTLLKVQASSRARRAAFTRLWRAVLWPPVEVALKMAARPDASGLTRVWARVAAPWRTLGAFRREIGIGRLLGCAARSAAALVRPRVGSATYGRSSTVAMIVLLSLVVSACATLRPGVRFLSHCPVDGPVVETDLAMYLEPVPLAAYYADLASAAADLPRREVVRIVSGDRVWPMYHIGPAGTVGGPRLLVVAGVHGNEIAGPLAAPRLLRELPTRPEYTGVELHLVAPANPIGLEHLSRYNGAGCDVNRDFGRFRTAEASAIRDVIAAVAPTLILALHEGPQDGFHVVASRRVPHGLAGRVAAAAAARGLALAQRNFIGIPLGTLGRMEEGPVLTWFKGAIGLESLGLFGERQGIPVLTTESPYGSADLAARVEAQLVAARIVAQSLSAARSSETRAR